MRTTLSANGRHTNEKEEKRLLAKTAAIPLPAVVGISVGFGMTYDTWKSTDPADSQPDDYRPCKWEKMSGICMVCGAGPDEECEYEREVGGYRYYR